MSMITLVRRSLWVSILIFILLLMTQVIHTQHFLSHSLISEGRVVDVSETALLKQATLRFKTRYHTVLDVSTQVIHPVKQGDTLPVLYNRIIPAELKIDAFFEIWFDTIVYASLVVLLFITLGVFNTCCNWRKNKVKKLKHGGDMIYSQFESVEAVLEKEKNGKHPYRIISSWYDQKTKKTHYFKSEFIWFNPVDYIMDQSISVTIDKKNKNKYLMDLSFLPDNMG